MLTKSKSQTQPKNELFIHKTSWFINRSLNIFGSNLVTFLSLAMIPFLINKFISPELFGRFLPLPTIAVESITAIAFTIAADKTMDGNSIGIIQSYILSLRFFVAYIWTFFLYYLRVWLPCSFIFIIVPSILYRNRLDSFTMYIIVMVSVVLLGLTWGVRYSYGPFLTIIKGDKGNKALARSVYLTKGNRGRIIWIQFLFLLPSLFLLGPYILSLQSNNYLFEVFNQLGVFAGFILRALFIIMNALILKNLISLKEANKNGM